MEEKLWLESAVYTVLQIENNDLDKVKMIMQMVEAYEAMKKV